MSSPKKQKVSHSITPEDLITLAKLNRSKTLVELAKLKVKDGVIYLKSNSNSNRKYTDTELPFRQESFYFYLTLSNLPDCHLTIDVQTQKSTLFIPKYPADHALWHGVPITPEKAKALLGVNECLTVDHLKNHLSKYGTIHVIDKSELANPLTNDSHLISALTEARVIKSECEINLMRKAADISSDAHIALMKIVAPGKSTELILCNAFKYHCSLQNAHQQAYLPIVGAGTNPAVLHHYSNDEPIPNNPEALVLVDAGCEVECYASDITRTYPLGGVYVGDYKTVYEIVLDANKTVINALKPGVKWEDMHRLAENVILKGLLKVGLGHLIGIDVHDCGGYPKGVERIPEPGIKYLRMRRTLVEGMVVTVEPGLYFVDALLDPAISIFYYSLILLADPKTKQFFNLDVLKRFRRVGGVRIEDDVWITKTGSEVLSKKVPKEIVEIESLMSKK
ncbi:hypothetical protein HDV02_003150 [Globomyces sp. JEL0801]|nr:hypothetical protein HDV02_003150 [Globomyces sp. JEL0801]